MNIDDIFENIDFKIKPNQNYRKEYIFRAKKLFYKRKIRRSEEWLSVYRVGSGINVDKA